MNITSYTTLHSVGKMTSNISARQSLEDWNFELAHRNTLSNVIQAIYLIVGLFGNSLVLIIYKFKMDPRKDDRYFIPTLAVVDLLGCMFSTTLSLLDNLVPVMFPSSLLCKVIQYGTCTFIVLSLLVLLVISIQRFQKICRPFGFQMTLSVKRISLLLVVVLANVMSIPILILYKNIDVHNNEKNISGTQCGSNPDLATMGDIYRSILIPFEVVSIVCMCIFYILVGKKLFHQFNLSRKLRDCPEDSNREQCRGRDSSVDSNTVTLTEYSRDYTVNNETNVTETNNQNVMLGESTRIRTSKRSNKNFKRTGSVDGGSHNRTRRYTIMFMVISLVAILCYIPPWVFVILETKDSKFWGDLSYAKAQAFLFIRRLYIVNHLANPFIYGFFDSKFRNEIRKMFLNACKRRR